MLDAYDAQLRGRTPRAPAYPDGAVFVRDGPIVRSHYSTHGTVDHRGPLGPDLGALISRQQEAFAARVEPVEWKVHAYDPPELARELVAAGFEPGWERSVLVAEIDALALGTASLPVGQRIRTIESYEYPMAARVHDMITASGPHHTPLAESDADGDQIGWGRSIAVLEVGGRVRAAAWALVVDDTEFVSIGGMTAPEASFLAAWIPWVAARHRHPGDAEPKSGSRWRYLVAEADGSLREMLLGAGFHEITTVRSYRWRPPRRPATERPVTLSFHDPKGDAIWKGFVTRWAFTGDARAGSGPTEPADSVTWDLGAIANNNEAIWELEGIVQRGLRAVVHPGERVYALNAYTQGYHFDPHRIGRPGDPGLARGAYAANGDDRLFITADLRTGTFGDPWQGTLCVFGTPLLAEIEEDLTGLPGIVLRRGGRPAGNIWTFGPEGHTITQP